MDAVRIEGTARSSLTRKRKISKLSRRIETRRQVGLSASIRVKKETRPINVRLRPRRTLTGRRRTFIGLVPRCSEGGRVRSVVFYISSVLLSGLSRVIQLSSKDVALSHLPQRIIVLTFILSQHLSPHLPQSSPASAPSPQCFLHL